MTNKEKLDRFLKELGELSNKHGFKICGCGCCGSPWIEEVNGNKIFDNLTFEGNTYKVDD